MQYRRTNLIALTRDGKHKIEWDNEVEGKCIKQGGNGTLEEKCRIKHHKIGLKKKQKKKLGQKQSAG